MLHLEQMHLQEIALVVFLLFVLELKIGMVAKKKKSSEIIDNNQPSMIPNSKWKNLFLFHFSASFISRLDTFEL
jgi:hypothetical protein